MIFCDFRFSCNKGKALFMFIPVSESRFIRVGTLSVFYFYHITHFTPYSLLQRAGKSGWTLQKASNTVQSVFFWTEELLVWCNGVPALLPPETATEELGSFEQNRWKVFLCWNEAQGMSHKCRIKDETRLAKRSNRFQKFLAPVHLHTRYCVIFCCEVGSVVYCGNFPDLGLWGPRNSFTYPKTLGGNKAKHMKEDDGEVSAFLIGFYTDLERLADT